jgi:Protein of unknown function (DUF1573)
MKKLHLTLLISAFTMLVFVSCNSTGTGQEKVAASPADSVTTPPDKENMPVISFEEDTHDFGKLTAGEKVTYSFKFKNTGKSALVISNVSTSCGCTVSSYPQKPVQPGEGATIDVSFNSEGKQGFQSKSITVYSNTEPPTTLLHIKAQVVEPAQ